MSKTVAVETIGSNLLPYAAVVTDVATGKECLGPIVFIGNPADGTLAGNPATVSFINTYFSCLHAFTGASIGDLIVEVVQYDVSVSPATVTSTAWLNATTGLALAGPPSADNLTYMGGAGLTDSQLRATPVPVTDAGVSAQLPATLGTKAAAASMSVALATEDKASLDLITTGYSAVNYSTTGTKLVHSGAATLHLVNINALGTVASTVKVYDGVDALGTLLATIDSLNLAGPNQFDIACATGICLVITGTASPDVTVSYR